MKKIMMIFLAVLIFALSGCSDTEEMAVVDSVEKMNERAGFTEAGMDESPEQVEKANITNTEKLENSPSKESQAPPEESPTVPEESQAPPKESPTVPEESQTPPKESPTVPEASQAPPEESPTVPEESQAPPKESPTVPEASQALPEESQAVPEESQAAPEEVKQSVAYDPNQVVALATEKTKALGKISIPEDLDNMLANGEITREEYDAYYPYDGAGYYSVFVETDLNEASTTSGRKLESVEGIADYIAGMLALETGPYFYIEYTGITNTGGRDFYEFRCYRA